MGGAEGICRGIDTALVYKDAGELVDDGMLVVILCSSIALSLGAAETWSRVPPKAATISGSHTPLSWRSARSFRFSSKTFLAALWISDEAVMPICS
jgi:hypothetical protein